MKKLLSVFAIFSVLLLAFSLVACNQSYNSKQSSGTSQESYWLNTSSHVRHNSSCEWYRNTKKGRPCTKSEGRPCGICGG